jgi:hypothetical protein
MSCTSAVKSAATSLDCPAVYKSTRRYRSLGLLGVDSRYSRRGVLAASTAHIGLVRMLLEHAPVANLLIVTELISIQTHHLGFVADAKVHARNELQAVQQDARNDERVRSNGTDLGKLTTNLDTNAIHAAETVVWAQAVKVVDLWYG